MFVTGFADLFTRYHAEVRPLGEVEDLQGAGGLSGAVLYRYLSSRGRMVLRRWPGDQSDRARIERIHQWLSRTAELEFIPVPIRDLSGTRLQLWDGGLWELAPWLEGSAHRTSPPEEGFLIAAVTGLARFHAEIAGLTEPGRSPGLARRLQTLTTLANGGFDLLEAAVQNAKKQADSELHDHALCWLRDARGLAPLIIDPLARAALRVLRLQPCLRDARPEHFLFQESATDPRLRGLVDFGAMDVDSVAGDLARLFSEWRVRERGLRAKALGAYRQIHPLEPDLIAAFEQSAALLGGERWIRWHFLESRRFGNPRATAQGLARAVERLRWLAQEGLGP